MQVRVASVQVHPVPLIAATVIPMGRVSTTVTVPDVSVVLFDGTYDTWP